mmetsp:Transcript_11316/g.20453  ORF Transcript_11316/g.20453 Transcript_11316/m.20453 type:complete len:154 (+) Transcript_11316:1480-1941(+)
MDSFSVWIRFDEGLKIETNSERFQFSLGLCYCLLGNYESQLKQYSSALEYFKNAEIQYQTILENTSNSILTHFNLGLTLYSRAQIQLAMMNESGNHERTKELSNEIRSVIENAIVQFELCLEQQESREIVSNRAVTAEKYIQLCEELYSKLLD